VGFAILASSGSKGTIGGTVRATLTHTNSQKTHSVQRDTEALKLQSLTGHFRKSVKIKKCK